jgi:hypothetical protein
MREKRAKSPTEGLQFFTVSAFSLMRRKQKRRLVLKTTANGTAAQAAAAAAAAERRRAWRDIIHITHSLPVGEMAREGVPQQLWRHVHEAAHGAYLTKAMVTRLGALLIFGEKN